jgi:tetratricopeptide (TPR) repeat protein
VNTILVGLLGALIATNQAAAVSNLVTQTTGMVVNVPDPNDPVEKEFRKIEAQEEDVRAEVDGWIRENQAFAEKGGAIPDKELNRRILKRFEPVQKSYQDFLKAHPNHVKAHVSYANFLSDIGDEDGEMEQLEKAKSLDPSDPDVWNSLANYYGHNGSLTNAFAYYAKAISLNPKEPIYYQNFATTVYLFRKDAREYYHINEQQVFDKALDLYAQGLKVDPTNFPLATDLAISYYGIKPLRTNDALQAWTNALSIAKTEVEREGVYIHLARVKLAAGRFAEVQAHLDAVTNEAYQELKSRLLRNLNEREQEAKTNALAAASAVKENSATNSPPVEKK